MHVNDDTQLLVSDACETCAGVGLIDKKRGSGGRPVTVPIESRGLMRLMSDE